MRGPSLEAVCDLVKGRSGFFLLATFLPRRIGKHKKPRPGEREVRKIYVVCFASFQRYSGWPRNLPQSNKHTTLCGRFIGQTFLSFYDPDDIPRVHANLRPGGVLAEDLATCPQKGLTAMTNATLFWVAQTHKHTHTIEEGGNRFSSVISSQSPERCCAAQLNFQPSSGAPTKTTKNSRNFHTRNSRNRATCNLPLAECEFDSFFLREALLQANKEAPPNNSTSTLARIGTIIASSPVDPIYCEIIPPRRKKNTDTLLIFFSRAMSANERTVSGLMDDDDLLPVCDD